MSLVALFALFGFPWLFTDHEANDDLREIWEDAENNSLNYKYHRQGLTFRVIVLVGFGLIVGMLNLWDTGVVAWLEFVGYCCYAAGVFAYDFSPRLNRWRMLFFPDYGISKWYVSRQPNASGWDRALVKYAPKFGLTPEELLQRVAWISLAGGGLIFAATIIIKYA